MQIIPELPALLKVMLKAYTELQVMLIDIQQYKLTWIMGGYLLPLDFLSNATGEQKDKPK